MDYRNTEEKNYYGSDLNKFVNEECSKEMTVINIDMLEYKRSLKKIRIIESKHNNERMPKSQEEILKIFRIWFNRCLWTKKYLWFKKNNTDNSSDFFAFNIADLPANFIYAKNNDPS